MKFDTGKRGNFLHAFFFNLTRNSDCPFRIKRDPPVPHHPHKMKRQWIKWFLALVLNSKEEKDTCDQIQGFMRTRFNGCVQCFPFATWQVQCVLLDPISMHGSGLCLHDSGTLMAWFECKTAFQGVFFFIVDPSENFPVDIITCAAFAVFVDISLLLWAILCPVGSGAQQCSKKGIRPRLDHCCFAFHFLAFGHPVLQTRSNFSSASSKMKQDEMIWTAEKEPHISLLTQLATVLDATLTLWRSLSKTSSKNPKLLRIELLQH